MSAINDKSGKRPYGDPLRLNDNLGDAAPLLHPSSGPRVTISLAVTALSMSMAPLVFGYSLGFTSPSQCQIKIDLWNETDCDSSSSEFALFTSLPTIGAIGGAMVGGPLAESIGRRATVISCYIPFVIGFFLVGLAEYSDAIGYIGRFLQGWGTGMTSSCVPIYIGEISPVHLRGAFGALFQLSITLGFLLVYSLYSLDWRVLSFVGAAPAVIGGGLLFLAPESPLYLVKLNDISAARKSLVRLRGKGYNPEKELEALSLDLDKTSTSSMTLAEKFSNLFTRPTFLPLVLGVMLMIAQQFSGINAVLGYSNKILTSAGVDDPSLGSIYIALVQVGFTLISTGVVDRLGRRPLLVLSSFGTTLACVGMGIGYHYPNYSGSSTLNLIGMLVYIASFSMGLGPVPWLIASEIYPSDVKGICVSITVIINWVMAFIVLFTFDSMQDTLGKDWTFWMFSIVTGTTLLGAIFLLPETKGKNKDEIAALFKKNRQGGYRRI